MQVLGRDEIARFLATHSCPTQRGEVKSFLSEVTYRLWTSVESLRGDFPEVRTGRLPEVTFVMCAGDVHINCLVNFDAGILLILTCKDRSQRGRGKPGGAEREAA